MNIYDVSGHAGVSIATVSRVLNGNPNVSERTRKKVLAVMDELGYTPNVFARGLGLDTMQTIGIMCSDSSDPYLAEAIYYLERELRSHDYDSILCCTGYDLDVKQKYFNLLRSKRVDAIILTGSKFVEMRSKDNNYITEAAANGLPVMLVNGYLEEKNIYSTGCYRRDDRTGTGIRCGSSDHPSPDDFFTGKKSDQCRFYRPQTDHDDPGGSVLLCNAYEL